MSNKVTKWAYNLQLPPTQKFVLITLAHYANDDGTCFPSFNTLSKMTCLSRRAIIYQILALEKLGVVTKITNEKYASNLYQLNIETNEFTQLRSASDAPLPVNDVHYSSAPDAPPMDSGVVHPVHHDSAPDALGGAPDAPALVHHVHPNNQLNNQLTIIEPSIKEKKDAQKENAQIIKINFEIFWQAYRKHKDRARAFKTFSKIKPDAELLHKMLDAIENQHTERIYQQRHTGWAADWKHPATWLNGENWNDEVNLDENYWRNSKRKSGQKTESLVERSRRERAERRGEATPNCYLDSITVEPNKQLTGERD